MPGVKNHHEMPGSWLNVNLLGVVTFILVTNYELPSTSRTWICDLKMIGNIVKTYSIYHIESLVETPVSPRKNHRVLTSMTLWRWDGDGDEISKKNSLSH